MISEIIFEQQGVTDLEAEIVNILKNDYDKVSVGEVIAEVETSKAVINLHASSNGFIKFTVSLNEMVKVADLIALIGDSRDELDNQLQSYTKEVVELDIRDKPISAKALKIAKSFNISIDTLKNHHISTVEEVNAYIESNTLKETSFLNDSFLASYKKIKPSKYKLSEIESLKLAQSLTLPCSCSIVIEKFDIVSFSEKHNLYFENIFPIIAKICSQELKIFKNMNGFYYDHEKYLYKDINIGFTVDANDHLQVLVVHNCDEYDKNQIQNTLFELMKSSISENISLEEMSKPTFIISDLSSVGDCFFHTPLLAPFTSSILGVALDKASSRLVLTLTYDHQMSSGKEALLFLKAIRLKLINEIFQ